MERLEAGLTAANRAGLQTGQPKQRREVCKKSNVLPLQDLAKAMCPLALAFLLIGP